jgi:penicillin amidase
MFALGVAHAQDRLWEMETHRRIAAGRLAEVFGEGALPTDRFIRALGVRRAAAAQWAALPTASREVLQAYADGVNAVLRDGLRVRPPEFVILGITPEPWEPIDSLGWAIMMAWDLSGNWTTELLRLRLALRMPVSRIDQMLPPYPGESPAALADYAALYRQLGLGGQPSTVSWLNLPEAAPASGIEGVGSNNWVLSGDRTTTGHPLLANDPHLKLSAPALWYFARIAAPGVDVAGATLPGVPGVVLGQNRKIAWGFTNTGPDVQDLYIERVDPKDPARYQTPDGWAAFESATEVIHVRGAPAVPITVRRTRHGPVLSDAGIMPDLIGTAKKPAYVLALRWTALDADVDPIAPAMAMQAAASVAGFIAATRGWISPMQNMVVADNEGHIGVVSPGRVPLRRKDNDLMGMVPSPGWDARYDWSGWLPLDETPRRVDPADGVIVTANQRITPPGYPHYLTRDWALPYRADRIEQLLQSRPRHSMEDLAGVQADVKSLAAPHLLPWLQKARSAHPLAAAAQAQLAAFDGTMAADKAAPLIFWAWQRELVKAVFADDAGPDLWERSLTGRSWQDSIEGVLSRDDITWCDDQGTPAVETCAQQADQALTRALDDIQALQGSEVSAWRWGRAHQLRAEHRPFSRVKALARWFELRAPLGGDTHTVNVSRVGLTPDSTTGELFLAEHGPSLRALYDLGDPQQSRVMHSSGQSGNVFSGRYRDFVGDWAAVRYVPLWPRADEKPVEVLTLKP